MGFRGEALLREHVRDRDGNKHDIVVLGHNVAQVHAQLEAYGLPEAVSAQGLTRLDYPNTFDYSHETRDIASQH